MFAIQWNNMHNIKRIYVAGNEKLQRIGNFHILAMNDLPLRVVSLRCNQDEIIAFSKSKWRTFRVCLITFSNLSLNTCAAFCIRPMQGASKTGHEAEKFLFTKMAHL